MKNQKVFLASLLAFFFPFLIYLGTMAPTVLWGDSAKMTRYVYETHLTLDIIAAHMLHTLTGKLFGLIPFGDLAWRQNFMSVFFGAATAFLFFRLLLKLRISLFSALLATLALALSHTFWHLSVLNESYTLLSFFMMLLLLLARHWQESREDRLLFWIGFFFGVGMCNHGILGLFAIGFAFFYFRILGKKGFRPRPFLSLLLSPFLGISIVLLVILWLDPSAFEINTRSVFLGNLAVSFESPQKALRELVRYPAYLFYQFPAAGFCLGLAGLAVFWKREREFGWMTALIFLADLLYAAPWWYQRKFFILLVSYLMFATWIGGGCSLLEKRRRLLWISALLLVFLPPLLYTLTPRLADRLNVSLFQTRELPYRDNDRFFLTPDKSEERGAQRYGLEALASAPRGSFILADFALYEVLKYYQIVEKKRPDITLWSVDRYLRPRDEKAFFDHVAAHLDQRPLLLADDEPDYYFWETLNEKYQVTRQGVLYRVEAGKTGGVKREAGRR